VGARRLPLLISLRYLEITSRSNTWKLPALVPGLPAAMLGTVTELGHSSLTMDFWQWFSPSFKAG